MYPELTYNMPFFISSFSIFVVGIFISCHQRKPRGIWFLAALCFAAAIWAGTEGMLYFGHGAETNILFTYIQYLGFAPLPPLLLLFTLSFFGYDRWLNRKTYFGLGLAGAATLLAAWTNPLHHLIYSDFYQIETGPVPMLGLVHGPLWWVMMGYHYALTILVGFILYRTIRTVAGPLRHQAALFLGFVCLVLGCNGVYISGNSPTPNMDPTPLAFSLVTIVMARGFYRHSFLGIYPIAKFAFFSALEDPILVLDARKRGIDLNPAAEKLLDIKASAFIGRDIEGLLKHRLHLNEPAGASSGKVLSIPAASGTRLFELRSTVLKNRHGSEAGYIHILHDVSERHEMDKAMRERERLHGVLEIAGTVSVDMARPIATITECSKQVQDALPPGHPDHDRGKKLFEQAERLKKTAHKLMGITRYETRQYLGGSIIDIEKASDHGEAT
jgi:hypothetical protein